MSGFATLADLRAAELLHRAWAKTSQFADLASSWCLVGDIPSPGTTPGTAHSNDASSLAVFPSIPSTQKFLVGFDSDSFTRSNACAALLIDRLVSVSQLVTSTGDKTINSAALPRYTDGKDVMVFLEVTTVTATSILACSLASYTNQDGSSGRAGASVAGPSTAIEAGTWIGPMSLQAGDSGVRSVETLNVGTASGGSGTVNVVLAKILAWSGAPGVTTTPQGDHPAAIKELLFPPRIYDGASLNVLAAGTAGQTPTGGGITVALDT